jgi:signal transduction histidine kinase
MDDPRNRSSELSVLLDRFRPEIVAAWVQAVSRPPGLHYRHLPPNELYAAAGNGVTAFVDALASDSDASTESYLSSVAVLRLSQGFDIGEAIEGLLLLRDVSLPIVWSAFPPGSTNGYQSVTRFDRCARYMIARFAHLYAGAMRREVMENHDRAEALAVENARLYEETRHRLAESQGLQRVAAALLEKLDLGEVLDIVCAEARQLTGSPGSTVFLLEGDDQWLRVARSTGTPWPNYDRLAVDRSFTGMVLRTGKARLTNTPASEPERFPGDIVPTALLAVPLRVKGVVIGALDLVDKPGGFTDEDVRVMGLFADQAAIAIENARLRHQVEELAVIKERQRLAHELHDSVTQSLYSMNLFAEAAGGLIASGNSERALDHLHQLRETAQESLREMRLMIFELHPPELEKEGLVAALQARLDSVENRGGLQCKLLVEGDERLAIAVEEELYRIAIEALNNVLKHARARHVTVHLRFTEERAYLEVADDGVGFPPSCRAVKGGLGLSGMEERARRIGASFKIASEHGEGSRVMVEVAGP